VGSEQHGPLRMPRGQIHDPPQGGRLERGSRLFRQPCDIGDRRVGRQRRQLQRTRLAEQGTLSIREQRAHQRWRAARVYVRDSRAVVLDHGPHESVQVCVSGQQILELVEADDGQITIGFVQQPRRVKQLGKDVAGMLCPRRRR
jgi:hypothetical protein